MAPATALFTRLSADPATIAGRVSAATTRPLLFGPPGVGKSTLATALGAHWAADGAPVRCLSADPGAPAFGVPGAVCLGVWRTGTWRLEATEALCSLNAARFRLPLVEAVRRLAPESGPLIVDGPGVVRGAAGAELLPALAAAAGCGAVVAVARGEPPLQHELAALGLPVFLVPAAEAAHRPGRGTRARLRTELWDAYLAAAVTCAMDLDAVQFLGTPPPLDVPSAWPGRQVAAVAPDRTLALGEVTALQSGRLHLRLPPGAGQPGHLLVRDAVRGTDGRLRTAEPFADGHIAYLPPPDVAPVMSRAGAVEAPGPPAGPRPVARVGPGTAVLINGVLGDPLLHYRLHHLRRSLLFDLGEAGRLPARIAHQVSDVFISHAHMDHIGGLLWLLRSRMGEFPPLRVFGPPGLAANIEGLLNGICWDRVGERGPRFEVAELHGDRLHRYRLQAGKGPREPAGETAVTDGVIHAEPAFRVRAATLDHGTPSIAYGLEPALQVNIRKERLAARGLAPGPWLTALKRHILAGERDVMVDLPDAGREAAGALADDLALVRPGQRLVYATDLADTAANRAALTALARGAHTLFCEAAFLTEDAGQAERTGHLTARACGEIATAADARHLVPFHFSRRYEREPERVYREVASACSRVAVPERAGTDD